MATFLPRHSRRRGVLLLLVLAMLAMFGLLAISFVVISGQAKRGAEVASRRQESDENPRVLMEEAIRQVLRGSTNPASVLNVHGLLEDVYGERTAFGRVDPNLAPPPVAPVAGGQLINLRIWTNPNTNVPLHLDEELTTAATNDDPTLHIGSVLTMIDGLAQGKSTRIVGAQSSPPGVQILAFDGVDSQQFVNDCNALLSLGRPVRFLLNGVPFGGTGFGLNTGATPAQLNSRDSVFNEFLALQPNYLYNNLNPDPAFLIGGANEDYDAADYQSMLLGMILPDGQAIPSLHRPELVRYWQNNGTSWNNPNFQRRVVLRPLQSDHPNFPSIDLVNGRWDVDNDGDGITDSIWVDLGLPARKTMDGRPYKPLFAILCLDMDGRLNLNAHGNYLQADRNADGSALGSGTPSYYGPVTPNSFSGDWGNTFIFSQNATPWLPRGFGYGPADVNLLPLFASQGANAIQYYANLLAARYGSTGVPGGPPGGPPFYPDDLREQNKWYEFGGAYWDGTPSGTRAYGSPPNRLTNGAIGLDPGGRPLYCGLGSTAEKLFDPYKMNLLKLPAVNSPFTVGELERLLRQYDVDVANLPGQRLVAQLGLQGQARNITTESWDIACPGAVSIAAILDRLAARHGNDKQWAIQNAPHLLPIELLSGRRMDVNRPFGNGLDDNNNGIVDEPEEAELFAEQFIQKDGQGNDVTVAFNHTNQKSNQPAMVRQLYARYLYVLALLAMDDDYFPSWITGNDRNARARWVAQWAVNVVDFRDRDSIMTCFEYDPDPFTYGWRPDGNPASDDGIATPHVVWGCERPELLITETLATHSRRVLNAQNVGPGEWTPGHDMSNPPANWDKDFDQTVRPEGSLFIELYHPWSPLEPLPAEFRNPPGAGGVRLNKTAPNGDPVWRMTIVAAADKAKDPDADPSFPASDRPAILRSIYFAPRPGNYTGDGDVQFSPNPNTAIPPISPGQYCVIGPGRDYAGNGKYITCFGRLQSSDPLMDPDMSKLTMTRRIELDPAAPGGVPVRSNSANEPAAAEIQPVLSVVIDQPHRLNISHPNDDYVAISATHPLPSDRPWDYDRTYDATNDPFARPINGKAPFLREGTTTQVAVVHLQRLADPTRGYNPVTNPYRTIDSAMIDLVAFNGWDSKDVAPSPNEMDSPVQDGTVMFATNQRGTTNTAADGANNIWVQHLESNALSAAPPETAGAANYFAFDLQHSLGYFNTTYTSNRITTGTHRGDPADAVPPWLTWNNRPFASPLEVLLVPAASSSALLNTAITGPYVPGNTSWPANAYAIDPNGSINPFNTEAGPFRHTLNFFHSAPTGTNPPTAPGFYRLLEALGVPSPFVGTEVQGADPRLLADTTNNAPIHALYPPFNLSTIYREPGRVNLNTITSDAVWQGLMNLIAENGGNLVPQTMGTSDSTMNTGFFCERVAPSRRGYTGGNWWEATDPAYPSRFANPFRSFVGAALNPVPPPMLQNAEVNATLLRADPVSPGTPLFAFDSQRFGGAVNDWNNPDRNPFFRYQSLARLSNLVTTRSNVYAVWITVGYFEAQPGPIDAAHPDGYRLGRELGSDTGEIKRHRAFFLIDRSIPVGFARGKDYNVGNTILLSRFIE